MKFFLFSMLAALAMAQEERDLKGGCKVVVLLTDDDHPTHLKFSADGSTCLKVNDSGKLKIYDVDHRRLTGGGYGFSDCQGKQLYNSDCMCEDRRRLKGGGYMCPDDWKVKLLGDGNLQIRDDDGYGDKLWKTNKTCNDRRKLKGGSDPCYDNYALVRNGCEDDEIQIWSWKKQGNNIVFIDMLWSENMHTENCLEDYFN